MGIMEEDFEDDVGFEIETSFEIDEDVKNKELFLLAFARGHGGNFIGSTSANGMRHIVIGFVSPRHKQHFLSELDFIGIDVKIHT